MIVGRVFNLTCRLCWCVPVRAWSSPVTPVTPFTACAQTLLRSHAALAEGFCSSFVAAGVVSSLVCQLLVNC